MLLYEYLANMLYLIVISNVVVNLCSNLKLYFIVFISKTFENFLSFKLSLIQFIIDISNMRDMQAGTKLLLLNL